MASSSLAFYHELVSPDHSGLVHLSDNNNIIRSVGEKEQQERELKGDFSQVKKLHFIEN